jgi:hypothetical protein
MKNLIVQSSPQMLYHTDVRAIFHALDGAQFDYEWVITDFECIALGTSWLPEPLQSKEDDDRVANRAVRLSGLELQRILDAHEVQFVWGVLSGFRPDRVPDLLRLAPYPIADGLSTLWSADATVQHPDAEVEIVCTDSSFTSFRSRRDALGERYATYFRGTIDLNSSMSRMQQWWRNLVRRGSIGLR